MWRVKMGFQRSFYSLDSFFFFFGKRKSCVFSLCQKYLNNNLKSGIFMILYNCDKFILPLLVPIYINRIPFEVSNFLCRILFAMLLLDRSAGTRRQVCITLWQNYYVLLCFALFWFDLIYFVFRFQHAWSISPSYTKKVVLVNC